MYGAWQGFCYYCVPAEIPFSQQNILSKGSNFLACLSKISLLYIDSWTNFWSFLFHHFDPVLFLPVRDSVDYNNPKLCLESGVVRAAVWLLLLLLLLQLLNITVAIWSLVFSYTIAYFHIKLYFCYTYKNIFGILINIAKHLKMPLMV